MQQSGRQGDGVLHGADVTAPGPGPTDAVDARSAGVRSDGAIPEDEREALRTRRRLAHVEDDPATPTVGLALSGGGIRSATFCLGLLRGMARRKLLSRFDYLSTVSGGGYTGAMFGRLVGRVGIAKAEEILAASDSRPLAWLRRYGRYLAPRGAKDYGMGLATYLRSMVAVHLEFAFLALALGVVAVLPHALHRQFGLFDITAWSGWPSAWWPFAAGLWLAAGPGLLGVYWMLRDPAAPGGAASRSGTGRSRSAGSGAAARDGAIPDSVRSDPVGSYAVGSDSATSSRDRPPRFRLWDLLVVFGAAVAGGALLAQWMTAVPTPDPAPVPTQIPAPVADASTQSSWVLPGPGWTPSLGLVLASLGVFGIAMAVALLMAPSAETGQATVARLRRRMTGSLRAVNMAFAVLMLLGLLDWASWSLLDLLGGAPGPLYGGLGIGGLVLLVLRALLEPAQKWLGTLGGGGQGMPMLAGALGYALAFLLVVLWTTLLQWCVFWPMFSPVGAPEAGGAALEGAQRVLSVADPLVWIGPDALWRWAACAAVLAVWFAGTGTNAESANTTSMHNMYAARLVRAYLGAVNPRRAGAGQGGDLAARLSASAEGTSPEALSNVTEVHPDDDLPLDRYDPSSNGGPIHLINVCLNQTRGHRSGLYNADRKGVSLVVGAHGLRVGRARVPLDGSGRLGTLGRWVAISGAAASPGAGAYTTPGWASLLFLAGARLGFWLDMHGAARALDPQAQTPRRFSGEWWRDRWQATKMGRLASEFRAVYGGTLARNWYLSDGGHFDNTGVHALLERELDLIVLADCGADPRYALADLENLVRKARIDFGADIEFYTGEDANELHRELCVDCDADGDDDGLARAIAFLSPERLADNATARGLLLARILYRVDREGRRKEGRLVVVKPNLHAALDMDLLAYARRNPRFPQQTTGDQFFDEAQWESYHRLGEDIGAQLRRDWLLPLAGRSRLDDPPRIRASVSQKDTSADSVAFWKLDARRAAVGALSLGALIAVLAPAWQVVEHVRSEQAALRRELAELIRDGRRLQAGLSGEGAATKSEADDPFVVSRLRVLSARFAKDSVEALSAQRLLADITAACDGVDKTRPVRGAEACGQLRSPPSAQTRLRKLYWGRTNAIAQTPEAAQAKESQIAKAKADEGYKLLRTDLTLQAAAVAEQVATAAAPSDTPPLPPPLPPADDDTKVDADAVAAACRTGTDERKATNKSAPVRLYIQVFDEAGRDALLARSWPETGLFGTDAPPIENVTVTAAARGERPPHSYARPTLILHDASTLGCAQALALWLAQPTDGQAVAGAADQARVTPFRIRALPKGYRGRPGVIELWWPPAASAQAAAD